VLRNVYCGTYFTHVQTGNVTRVQSATEWTASVHTLHMSKPAMQPVFKCYGMDCFGTHFTHVQTCNVTRVQSATEWTYRGTYFTHVQTCNVIGTYFTHVQTCNVTGVQVLRNGLPMSNVTPVQSATGWTARYMLYTLHMSKPVMYPVFKVLRNVYWALGSPNSPQHGHGGL